jgi:hypothetical protein
MANIQGQRPVTFGPLPHVSSVQHATRYKPKTGDTGLARGTRGV